MGPAYLDDPSLAEANDFPTGDPSPGQIARRCAAIQGGWSALERRWRLLPHASDWEFKGDAELLLPRFTVPVVKLPRGLAG